MRVVPSTQFERPLGSSNGRSRWLPTQKMPENCDDLMAKEPHRRSLFSKRGQAEAHDRSTPARLKMIEHPGSRRAPGRMPARYSQTNKAAAMCSRLCSFDGSEKECARLLSSRERFPFRFARRARQEPRTSSSVTGSRPHWAATVDSGTLCHPAVGGIAFRQMEFRKSISSFC